MLKSIAAPAPARALEGSVSGPSARTACIQSGGSWDAGSNTCTPPAPVCEANGYPCGSSGGG